MATMEPIIAIAKRIMLIVIAALAYFFAVFASGRLGNVAIADLYLFFAIIPKTNPMIAEAVSERIKATKPIVLAFDISSFAADIFNATAGS